MKTMSQVYKEPNDRFGKHICCRRCGMCIDCRDCDCKTDLF